MTFTQQFLGCSWETVIVGGGRRKNHKPQQGERVYAIVPCFPTFPQINIRVAKSILSFHILLALRGGISTSPVLQRCMYILNMYLMIAASYSYSQGAELCLHTKAFPELGVCVLLCLFKCNQTLSVSFPTTGALQLQIISLSSQILTISSHRVKLQTLEL